MTHRDQNRFRKILMAAALLATTLVSSSEWAAADTKIYAGHMCEAADQNQAQDLTFNPTSGGIRNQRVASRRVDCPIIRDDETGSPQIVRVQVNNSRRSTLKCAVHVYQPDGELQKKRERRLRFQGSREVRIVNNGEAPFGAHMLQCDLPGRSTLIQYSVNR